MAAFMYGLEKKHVWQGPSQARVCPVTEKWYDNNVVCAHGRRNLRSVRSDPGKACSRKDPAMGPKEAPDSWGALLEEYFSEKRGTGLPIVPRILGAQMSERHGCEVAPLGWERDGVMSFNLFMHGRDSALLSCRSIMQLAESSPS